LLNELLVIGTQNTPKMNPEKHYTNRSGWLRAAVLGLMMVAIGSVIVN
jgi:hypothetical protein